MANKQAIQDDLLAMLTATTGASATEKQKLRDRFVLLYQTEFQKFLTDNSLTDTAANRGKFVCNKTVGFWADIFRAGSQKEIDNARAQPETL
jgi:hypothetical protein